MCLQGRYKPCSSDYGRDRYISLGMNANRQIAKLRYQFAFLASIHIVSHFVRCLPLGPSLSGSK